VLPCYKTVSHLYPSLEQRTIYNFDIFYNQGLSLTVNKLKEAVDLP